MEESEAFKPLLTSLEELQIISARSERIRKLDNCVFTVNKKSQCKYCSDTINTTVL